MNTFDQETHTYGINGVIVPSITQLLPKEDYYVSKEKLERMKQEGIDSHSMIKMFFDTGKTFDDPMLQALSKFLKENKLALGELLLYEKPLYSEKYLFAGTPDAVFENGIIDFKRSFSDKKRHALQLAGQSILAKENSITKTKRHFITWYDGEMFKYKNVYNSEAENIFLLLVKDHYIGQSINKYLGGKA